MMMRSIKTVLRYHIDIIISVIAVMLIVGLDRATKVFFSNLLAVGESLPIIRNVLHMTLVHNTGIAFGLFKDQGVVFIIIPIIAIVLLVYNIYFFKSQDERLSVLYMGAFSMILGGAFGNLIDRVYYGYVIDFIDLRVWPVFNIADSAITVGAVIIAVKCIPGAGRE